MSYFVMMVWACMLDAWEAVMRLLAQIVFGSDGA